MKKYWIKHVVLVIGAACCLSGLFACRPDSPTIEQSPSVVLNEQKLKLEVGASFEFSATCAETGENVVWISYDNQTVSIDENGKAIALQAGQTTVVAQAGIYSDSCDILVVEPTVEADNVSMRFVKDEYTIDANSQNNTAKLEVVVYLNGQEMETQVEWSSSNEEFVSVTQDGEISAIKNGGTALITATANVNGDSLSSVCRVATEPFSYIIMKEENIALYPQETKPLSFDVYIDGAEADDSEKAKTKFSSLNESVAKVSENGEITGIKTGTTQIVVQYGSKTSYIDVQVGSISYIENVNQLINIDKAEPMQRYILTKDIDMSEHCKQNPFVDNQYLFEKFEGELIGNGHTISGFHRFSTSNDEGFLGVFKELGNTSLLKNVAFSGVIENAYASSLLALNCFGRIEDCSISLSGVTGFANQSNTLFELNNGSIQNTVIKIFYNNGENNTLTVSPNGYGTYQDVTIISDGTIIGGNISGVDSQLNEEFDGCVWYKDEQDFINKNGYSLSGVGVGELVDFNAQSQFDESIFKILDGKIVLCGVEQLVNYPKFTVEEYQDIFLGESLTLHTPEETMFATNGVNIINQNGENITSRVCQANTFIPDRTGVYYIVHYVCENGYYGFFLREIKVLQNKPFVNATTVVLQPQGTFAIEIDGLSNDNFIFVSNVEEVASVDEKGQITAKAVGATSISVYSKTGSLSYTIYVSVMETYTEIATVDEFIELLSNATTGERFVLTADIEIPKERVTTTEDTADTPAYSYVIENFYGILDGQGHTVSLEMRTSKALSGLFKNVCRKAEIRNLNYNAAIYYTPYNRVAYAGTFCLIFSGYMENCYLKSNLYPTTAPTDQEGIIAVGKCEDGFSGTSEIRGCIFEINTEFEGKICDNGYAIRAGTAPVITVRDSVLIKNGLQADFYSGPAGASAVELSSCFTYKTIYDFIYARQGKQFSTKRVAISASDGAHVYANWDSVWQMEKDSIYLCGKKVADVAFVNHITPKTISLTDNFGRISWIADSTEYEIYVNNILCGKTQESYFDIQNYVMQAYGSAEAEYKIFVKGDGVAGVNVYKVVHLTQDNFISQLRAMDTATSAANKLFVLTEDVTASWEDFKNYGNAGIKLFNNLYANVDGRGHCVKVEIDTNSKDFTGIMGDAYGVWRNTYFNIKAKYVPNNEKERRILINGYVEGAFVNNYVLINVNPTDENGNSVKDDKVCVIGSTYGTAENRNNVYHLNVTAENNDTLIYVYGVYSSLGPTMNNCAVIRNHSILQLSMGYVIDRNGTPLSCEKRIINTGLYTSLTDFINGQGYVVTREINAEVIKGETAVYEEKKQIYKNWNNVWAIEEEGIALCGRTVLKIVDVGDDFIQDDSISNIQQNA